MNNRNKRGPMSIAHNDDNNNNNKNVEANDKAQKKEHVTKFVYAAKCRGTYFIFPLKPDTKDTLSNTSLIHMLRSTQVLLNY